MLAFKCASGDVCASSSCTVSCAVKTVFAVQKRPESDRISLVKGQQMEVYSRGYALQGRGLYMVGL